ncbi:NADH-quinone oxidoreductase subunit C [Candidatus Kinetoplastidibacterium crithidiae]|uniref:NADH-quinone oxidoreductase subunit C n=1 Tax=Candidatus Kinetoplastidibacterium crithidiae TCC036E TaxID=1208918 RepID=M1L567_9PROT|nr:NADH-quinone oxidoreductase subunit C [Candidatus Kinetoplastibacterium crithidii]AFZ82555.1 NADH dehydrogenase subunit C [Candidatus Kinetoplastibacterium crithidii (ex Angomonas deanei ATCC 30255)]AGF47783.1 NADH dehydrogenase I subunit C [Candidatus Kinetoplastibacterium crithidii TCC036E]
MNQIEILKDTLKEVLVNYNFNLLHGRTNELTLEISSDQWLDVCNILKLDNSLYFETCIDLCAVDYLSWGKSSIHESNTMSDGKRFAVVIHVLSIVNNWRLRVRTWANNNDFPVIPSLINCWPSVNWFEREAFDLFGIVFHGHKDLRRIITDYGFVGYPFRKDFPLSGNVEVHYDESLKKVVYKEVSIDTREITPRVIRENSYGLEL